MDHRITFALLTAALVTAACGSEEPPQVPTPNDPPPTVAEPDTMAERLAREAFVRDSLAEVERLRAAAAAATRTSLTQVIHFDYDQSALTSSAREILRQKLEPLRCNSGVTLRIEGHADERGSSEYNLVLGNSRAQAAKDFMVSFGVAENRLTTQSFGEERPVANGSSESAWAQNRRDEFVITAGGNNLTGCQ